MPRLVRLALIVLAVLALAAPVRAAETILQFTDAVVLGTDGTVDVTETIDVNAEGQAIRHGIFRDIPTVMVNADGSRLRSALHVLSVTRDDRPEPFSTGHITNGVRIRIGDADRMVPPGRHRYVIHYTMSRMARRFADHDELYWNATGNYWQFPILSASVAVTLPDGAAISKLAAYTGRPGSTESDATAQKTAPNVAVFRTTRALQPQEGLSVAIAFQKGVLATPGPFRQATYWLSDHRDIILPGIAVLLVLAYNVLAWLRVGRDPRRGTIIPLFHPPAGLSPAMVHYVHNYGWKRSGWTAFTATIFDLGVHGRVSVDNTTDTLKVTARGEGPASGLSDEETILDAYFRANGVTTVDKVNGPALDGKRRQVMAAVKAAAGSRYFRNNYVYAGAGVVLAIAMLGLMVMLDVLDPGWFVAGIVALVVLVVLATSLGSLVVGGTRGLSRIFLIVWAAIFGVNILGATGAALTSLTIGFAAVAAISIVLVTVVFAWLMRAATVQGRTVMDRIDGLHMYMETAEKNRMNFRDEPQMSVDRFEALLPFAIALGVEKPWTDRFEADLARNAVAGAANGVYAPVWYSGGTSFDSRGVSRAISSVPAAMSAAMIAAQPARSSSSGFSGGGGSGGGGGGGGGGGW